MEIGRAERWKYMGGAFGIIEDIAVYISINSLLLLYVVLVLRYFIGYLLKFLSWIFKKNLNFDRNFIGPIEIMYVMALVILICTNVTYIVGLFALIFGPNISVFLLFFFGSVILLMPNIVTAFEIRRMPVRGPFVAFIKVVSFFIILASIPTAMTIVTICVDAFLGSGELSIDGADAFLNSNNISNQNFGEQVDLFWINETFQSIFMDIPDNYGFKFGQLEYNKSSIIMSTIVVSYKIFLSIFSLSIIFNKQIMKAIYSFPFVMKRFSESIIDKLKS